MMPSSSPLLAGLDLEAVLKVLRPLSWGAADILRAYARGEQPLMGSLEPSALTMGGRPSIRS